MDGLVHALLYGVIYAAVGVAILVLAFYVLDLLTPGSLGEHLFGSGNPGTYDQTSVSAGSYSAGLVTAGWVLGNASIIFTAIWFNGDSSLGAALAWTVAFGIVGIVVNTVMLLVMDAITPGNLRAIITTPGPAVPLAYIATAATLGISAIICASIAG